MKYTVSLTRNKDFRRLYARGKSAVSQVLAVYARKNGLQSNRLGITAGTKIGNAVKRNLVRRRIRESYRLCEETLKTGYDIVIVARTRAVHVNFREISGSLTALMDKLQILK